MTSIIVATDIFGHTPELVSIANALPHDAVIVDPYGGRNMNFVDEHQAYSAFSETVGLDQYSAQLRERIEQTENPVSVLGFSVGASAIWQASEGITTEQIISAHLFYSSQIRHLLEILPNIPITLVFPAAEQHFAVPDVIEKLQGKPNVSIHQADALHGFMNQLSNNFDLEAYDRYMAILSNLDWRNHNDASVYA